MKLLHYKRIVHRDLKPDKILLDEHLYPKISDFGCSCISTDDIFDLLLNSEEGTPAYMAPAIFTDEYFTYKIDIYSFALIAYELITGKKPFSEYSKTFNLINDVTDGKRPDINELDPIIQSFLSKCWDSDFSKRPTFGQIVDEMMKPEFKEAFGILDDDDDDEIENYLDLFDNDLLDPKQMDCLNLKEKRDKKWRLQSETKLPKNGTWLDTKEIIDFYKPYSSSKTNPQIKIMLEGILNINGDENDKKRSSEILKKYAEEKNVEAMHHYAEALRYGRGTKKDLKKAAHFMKMAADLGDLASMEKYADMLHEGIGVPVNPKEAVKYVKIAADKGDNCGRLFYGIILKDGNVIERDIDEAVKYIKMAVDDGYILAISFYGEMLFYGYGVQINIKEGIRYIKFAADNGSILSMHDYASILMDGIGVPSNMEESMRYFKMAADEGFPPSIYCYGRFLLLRDENDGNDIKEACKYFKIGATLGDFLCIKVYALILIGIGNEIDKKEGFRYLRLTADAECFEKMNFFTKMVSESCFFSDQLGEQIQQIKIQIENDRIDSMYRCGMMLYEGDGIECNKVEAAKYFKMAADKKHVLSMNRYATMLYEGDGIECNKVEAAKFFKISADAGSVNSMYRYSLMLKNGDGIPVNNDEYFKYVKMLHEKESENNFHMAHHLRKDAKIVFTGKHDKDEKISVHYPQNIIGRNKPSQNKKPKNVIFNDMSLQTLFSLFFIIASIIALLQFLLETE